jgi:hypothetical protein
MSNRRNEVEKGPVAVYHRFLSESGFSGFKDVQDWDCYPENPKIL